MFPSLLGKILFFALVSGSRHVIVVVKPFDIRLLDGGGVASFSSLLILRALMRRIARILEQSAAQDDGIGSVHARYRVELILHSSFTDGHRSTSKLLRFHFRLE